MNTIKKQEKNAGILKRETEFVFCSSLMYLSISRITLPCYLHKTK